MGELPACAKRSEANALPDNSRLSMERSDSTRRPQQFAFYFFRVLFRKSAQRTVHCFVSQPRRADKFRMKQGVEARFYPFALFAVCHCVCSPFCVFALLTNAVSFKL